MGSSCLGLAGGFLDAVAYGFDVIAKSAESAAAGGGEGNCESGGEYEECG
jgi:hypothetical protein